MFTTRTWDEDQDGIRSVATHMEADGVWVQRWLSLPSPYMPLNPLPEESTKQIRYCVYEVLAA